MRYETDGHVDLLEVEAGDVTNLVRDQAPGPICGCPAHTSPHTGILPIRDVGRNDVPDPFRLTGIK